MANRTVIVFGPTGAVGSAAARTAGELGAKVILAMRNVEKAIPGLDAETEKQGKFERVTADLTKPDTVREAVTKSKAEHAFIYLAHSSPDHMKGTIEALKAGGIRTVVFLSSFTVRGDMKAIKQTEIIPWIHAQVELSLLDVFDKDAIFAARPGSFASNTLAFKSMIESGEVRILTPDAKVDGIVPEDIGRVCGTVLANGPQDDSRAVYLYGPELQTQKESVEILAKALGKNPTYRVIDEEEAIKMFQEERGLPEHFARYMAKQTGSHQNQPNVVFGYPVSEDDLRNVEKYSGQRATTFQEFIDKEIN